MMASVPPPGHRVLHLWRSHLLRAPWKIGIQGLDFDIIRLGFGLVYILLLMWGSAGGHSLVKVVVVVGSHCGIRDGGLYGVA